MTGTESGKGTVKKRTRVKVDPMDLYALTLPPYHMSVKDIAAKYGMHEVTCSNKISEVKKKLEPIYAAQRAELEKPRDTTKVSVRKQGGGDMEVHLPTGSVPAVPDTNPFHALSSFAEVAAPSIQAAMVVGSAIGLIGESLNRELPREQRYEMAGKSGISLFVFGLGLLDALDAMEQKNKNLQLKPLQESEQ